MQSKNNSERSSISRVFSIVAEDKISRNTWKSTKVKFKRYTVENRGFYFFFFLSNDIKSASFVKNQNRASFKIDDAKQFETFLITEKAFPAK